MKLKRKLTSTVAVAAMSLGLVVAAAAPSSAGVVERLCTNGGLVI